MASNKPTFSLVGPTCLILPMQRFYCPFKQGFVEGSEFQSFRLLEKESLWFVVSWLIDKYDFGGSRLIVNLFGLKFSKLILVKLLNPLK